MLRIVQTCCILHNMILKKRNDGYAEDEIGGVRGTPQESFSGNVDTGLNLSRVDFADVSQLISHVIKYPSVSGDVKCEVKHQKLKHALVGYTWACNGSSD